MRLNVDALADLVVMSEGSVSPIIVETAPMATFIVTCTANDGDANLGDGICAKAATGTCPGACTYLAARQQENSRRYGYDQFQRRGWRHAIFRSDVNRRQHKSRDFFRRNSTLLATKWPRVLL